MIPTLIVLSTVALWSALFWHCMGMDNIDKAVLIYMIGTSCLSLVLILTSHIYTY